MWTTGYLKCLVKGHISSSFTYKGSEYVYCLSCGAVHKSASSESLHVHSAELSQGQTPDSADMVRI